MAGTLYSHSIGAFLTALLVGRVKPNADVSVVSSRAALFPRWTTSGFASKCVQPAVPSCESQPPDYEPPASPPQKKTQLMSVQETSEKEVFKSLCVFSSQYFCSFEPNLCGWKYKFLCCVPVCTSRSALFYYFIMFTFSQWRKYRQCRQRVRQRTVIWMTLQKYIKLKTVAFAVFDLETANPSLLWFSFFSFFLVEETTAIYNKTICKLYYIHHCRLPGYFCPRSNSVVDVIFLLFSVKCRDFEW